MDPCLGQSKLIPGCIAHSGKVLLRGYGSDVGFDTLSLFGKINHDGCDWLW